MSSASRWSFMSSSPHTESVGSAQQELRLALLKYAVPLSTWVLFITYPLVTNVAFDAFPCYEFNNGTHVISVLRADVTLLCAVDGEKTGAWREVQSVATVAIVLYTVGQLVLTAALLLLAHKAICSEQPTTLSTGISFLFREYDAQRGLFYWEARALTKRGTIASALALRVPCSMRARPALRDVASFCPRGAACTPRARLHSTNRHRDLLLRHIPGVAGAACTLQRCTRVRSHNSNLGFCARL
jgi:hypothetical protein